MAEFFLGTPAAPKDGVKLGVAGIGIGRQSILGGNIKARICGPCLGAACSHCVLADARS